MWACVYRRRGNFHERSTHVFHGLNNFQEILFFADGCDHEIFEPNINFVFKRSRTCKWPKQLRRRLSAYHRRTNFCGHNILCVKFSWGQIFVGGGSPWKFNPHKTIVVHETRMAVHGVRKMSSIRRCSVTRWLASAIAAEGILDDSEPLGIFVGLIFVGNACVGNAFVGNACVDNYKDIGKWQLVKQLCACLLEPGNFHFKKRCCCWERWKNHWPFAMESITLPCSFLKTNVCVGGTIRCTVTGRCLMVGKTAGKSRWLTTHVIYCIVPVH